MLSLVRVLFFFFFFILFINIDLHSVVLGLHRYTGFSLVVRSGGDCPATAHRLLTVAASLAVECGL